MPAARARTNVSRRVNTKLMSVRNGLVGSTASVTPSSLARAAAGAIRSQNSSAASSHVPRADAARGEPDRVGAHRGPEVERLADHAFLGADVRHAQPGVGDHGRVPVDRLELRGDGSDRFTPSSRKNPTSSETDSAPAHSSLTDMRGCADTRAEYRSALAGDLVHHARAGDAVGECGHARSESPSCIASRTSFTHGSISV